MTIERNVNFNFWNLNKATASLVFLWLLSSVGRAQRAVRIAWARRRLLLALHWRRVIWTRHPALVGGRDRIVGWRASLSTSQVDGGGWIWRDHGTRASSVRRDSLILRRVVAWREAALRTDPGHHHLVVGWRTTGVGDSGVYSEEN